MKKTIAVLLAALMLLSLFACAKSKKRTDSDSKETPASGAEPFNPFRPDATAAPDPKQALTDTLNRMLPLGSLHLEVRDNMQVEGELSVTEASIDMQKLPAISKANVKSVSEGDTYTQTVYSGRFGENVKSVVYYEYNSSWAAMAQPYLPLPELEGLIPCFIDWVNAASSVEQTGASVYACTVSGGDFMRSLYNRSDMGMELPMTLTRDVTVTFTVDSASGMVTRCRIDAGQMIGEAMESAGVVALSDITLSQFNEVDTIMLPADALAAVQRYDSASEAPAVPEPAPEPEPAQPDRPAAITYDVTVWTGEAAVELTQRQIDDFNRTNTDGLWFNAAVYPVSEATSADQMLVDMAAGADLFCFAQDQFARLVRGGALSMLDNRTADMMRAANDPGSVAAATSGDTMYAYPMTSDNGYFMYYDKTVIPEEDVDSLEKLIEDCEKSGRTFCFEVETSAWYIASWFFATGCKSEWTTDDDGSFISVVDTFNSPEGLIAVKGMKKLLDSPCHLSSSSGDEFASDAAIVVTGTWHFESIQWLLGDNMGCTDLPSFEVGGKSYHLGSFNGCKLMGVKPQWDAERETALHKLAQYLTDETRQMERFNALSWGPSNLNAQQSEAVQANPGLAALLKQNQYSVPQGMIHGAWWDIAKVIADDVKAATDDAGLQTALTNYSNKIKLLFGDQTTGSVWGAIGAIGGTMWDVDFPMYEIDPGLWITDPIYLNAGEEFKVRRDANWDINYGKDGVAGGENCVVDSDGLYYIVFDSTTGDIWLDPAQ